MPTDEALMQQAEEWKTKGNEAFQKGAVDEALQGYSQGIVACDRLTVPPAALKAALLSNRAMCYLKVLKLQPCMDDCTSALALDPDSHLRCKLLFRRAKATFLLSNVRQNPDLLQDAAKDLLQLLQLDPKNTEGSQLLITVRAQHKQQQTATTPVRKTVEALSKREGDTLHNIKLLLGFLENDLSNASMELGRTGAVTVLLEIASEAAGGGYKTAILAVQCLSHAGSHPAFVRAHLVDRQADLRQLVLQAKTDPHLIVSALAVYVRIILHADRDDPNQDITGQTALDYTCLLQTCTAALRLQDKTVIRAVLDVLSTWTAGTDRDAAIRASLAGGGAVDPLVPIPVTQAELRAMTPQQLAAHRKRESDQRTRDEAWAFERGILVVQSGMKALLQAATSCADHVVQREITVTIGRILAGIESEDKIKEVIGPLMADERDDGVIIEEVYNDAEEKEVEEEEVTSLETIMERAIITCALLLSKKEVGAWALSSGWKNSVDDLPTMIKSGDSRAMCLASEVVSAAATLESARHIVTNLITSGLMEKLLTSDDRDIRSGAASAVAKVGLTDKETSSDEGEIMHLLQGACDLLEDKGDAETGDKKDTGKLHRFSSFATSSVERGVEVINYLVANTTVKEELAAGFQAPGTSHTALERLVEVSSLPNAGESLSGFGLATIFQHMAVTNLQLRKEMFEGKEVTMEQYDEMQKMGKTEEEKEIMEKEKDTDSQESCNERIRKMATANVPRAIVALMEGASEHTLEQLVLAMNRMAVEPSVRGIMIQQGVLSSCIKVETNEGPTETDTMKKVIRLARHCIAKILITTNPNLLTSAQRLGSVRPLLQLVRDIKASDLQQFEALLALTNVASSGDDAKERIVSEKGIPALHFAMFSDHELVQRAATEAMCNLVPHKAMMDHLSHADNLKLWLAFAADYEEHYECARAAAGCLAMATQDESIALELSNLEKFGPNASSLIESGRLEIIYRALYIILNMLAHGAECKEKLISSGLVAFSKAYVDNYHNNKELEALEFPEEERALLPATVEIAKKIVNMADSS